MRDRAQNVIIWSTKRKLNQPEFGLGLTTPSLKVAPAAETGYINTSNQISEDFNMAVQTDAIYPVLNFLSVLFVLALGAATLAIVAFFIVDITQRKDAVRRNYPVIGRFRYLFSTLGEFFRQYFFGLWKNILY